ncbi:RDD family protein [Prauserella flavalba]|uniref:Transporter n=1 Tax=Prauserella flavalba TaxID=1477506 RepID=A0A318LY69_9PSEU|nr:RDD family protein [Prauserella flavalba]PXY37409.1 transporter [Prauserella flavalba]
MQREPDLVTGDAVVLDLRLARSASRALSYGLDLLVQVASLLLVLLVFALTSVPEDTALVVAIVTAVQVLVLVGYPAMCETLTRGRTLGKAALGLRVVRDDGGPIRFRHALVRALAGAFVDFGPFGAWSVVGFLTSLASAKGKRVGDYLAGTVVIRDRVPEPRGAGLVMPPALAHWAAQLDLTRLPDALALQARQYLGRYHELNQGARDRIGAELAAEIAQHIGAEVPPYTPAWAYLSAVLAERQARDYARLSAAPRQQEPPAEPPRPSTSDSPGESPFAPPS